MTAIILDCDPGHDDAIALLLALASPALELLGVTTVAGNQTVEKTTANAIRVLDHVGRADIPVAAGADRPLVRELRVARSVTGESGLDGAALPPASRSPDPAHAIDWIARTLTRTLRPVTLVATGPLTNLALFLARYPELHDKVARVVLMGGAIGEGNATPAAEFNIWVDPEAAHRVFASGLDLTMVGLDVTHQALLKPAEVQRLAAAGRAGNLVADLFEFFVRFHRERYGWEGAPIHDAVALAHVVDPGILRTREVPVAIDIGAEPSRGRTHVDLLGVTRWPRNAHVAVGIDPGRFIELLLERISSLG